MDSLDQIGDPTRSTVVKEYIIYIRQEQGKAGVFPRGARTMERFKMDVLIDRMKLTIRGLKKEIKIKTKERNVFLLLYC